MSLLLNDYKGIVQGKSCLISPVYPFTDLRFAGRFSRLHRNSWFENRCWVTHMNAFFMPDEYHSSCMRRLTAAGQISFFQELDEVERASRAIGSSETIVWSPPLTPREPVPRAKRAPRRDQSFVLCRFGYVGGLRKPNIVIGAFRRARELLGGDRLRFVLVERNGAKIRHQTPLNVSTGGFEYFDHGLPHDVVLDYYEHRCHLGIRVEGGSLGVGKLGTKVIEMAAYGLPSLTDDSPTNRKLLGDDYAYYWRESTGVKGMVQLIMRAVERPREYERMAELARASVYNYTLVNARMFISKERCLNRICIVESTGTASGDACAQSGFVEARRYRRGGASQHRQSGAADQSIDAQTTFHFNVSV
jgi:glycosyltransferase involved in cell wall biosynthesis